MHLKISDVPEYPSQKPRFLRNFCKGDYDSIISALLELIGQQLATHPLVLTCYIRIVETCQNIIEKYVPLETHRESYEIYPRNVLLKYKVDSLYYVSSMLGSLENSNEPLPDASLLRKGAYSARNVKGFFNYCKKKLKLSESIPDFISGDTNKRRSRQVRTVC